MAKKRLTKEDLIKLVNLLRAEGQTLVSYLEPFADESNWHEGIDDNGEPAVYWVGEEGKPWETAQEAFDQLRKLAQQHANLGIDGDAGPGYTTRVWGKKDAD